MKSERPTFPSDVWLYIETARSVGADEAELASLVTNLRERSQTGTPSETMEALFVYARDLAEHVSKTVDAHQLSLPLEVIAASRRVCKELDWIEQDLLLQRQLWQAVRAAQPPMRTAA